MVLNRLIFSLWYFGRPPWDSGISPPELLEFIQTHPAGHAIDLGCGTGTNVVTLARAGWQVTGVDFASRAVHIARRKIKRSGIQANAFVADVTRLSYDALFDLALDIGCFHGVSERAAYLDTLVRMLKPGAHWLMYGFFKPEAQASGPGLVESDLAMIERRLKLIWRREGTDKRERPSAWHLFQKVSGLNQ